MTINELQFSGQFNHTKNYLKVGNSLKNPSPPRRRGSISIFREIWIPAFAGMTIRMRNRLFQIKKTNNNH